ncbi:MAG: HlyC/CorC family transporter [Clostridia bacterium]|nr:HlyC/CorC family transporter [Clostridia bacterium]MBQ8513627.1 HlyC/CorC family transporter [Clostridia bacterium]
MNDNIVSLIIMAICIIGSAYFSATETAFLSMNKTRMRTFAEKGDKRAALAMELSEKYDKLISTILIGNNIVNITLSSLCTVMFVKILGDMGATVSTAVSTVVVLIFGEITPKSIAKDFPETFAKFSAPFMRVLLIILTPLNFLFSAWKKLVSKLFSSKDDDKMSQEELLMFVEEVQQDGSIDTDEGDLIKNAIEFTERTAEDILTHRVDLEAVPSDATKEDVAEKFTETRFSRLLVFEETIDKIIGVINQKDFYVGTGITVKSLAEITTQPIFIHRSEEINALLKLLQKEKSHIAVVLDDYGGTLGIVTMEDILEELVGDIWDEHDEVVEDFREVDDDTCIVDCSINFTDFCDRFDIESDTNSVSLGGWINEQMGKIPEEGDEFEYENLYITITETDGKRVSKVKVVQLPEKDEEEAEEDDE